MKILALEMSTARGSIALREDATALFDCDFAADRKHSGAFFENVQLCLHRFGLPEECASPLPQRLDCVRRLAPSWLEFHPSAHSMSRRAAIA